MADDNEFNIGIGSKADEEQVKKALGWIENEAKKSADKQADIVKDGGKKQAAETNKTEKTKTDTVKNESKKRQDLFKKEGNISLDSIKDFVKGAAGELFGLDQVLGTIAGGPIMIGKAIVQMGKAAIAELNKMADAYRQQEQVEISLQNAIKDNPYLNDRNLRLLKEYANEMQRKTGIDSAVIMQAQTTMSTAARNQEQMMKVIKVAADMAAAGMMDFDSAVKALSNTYVGILRITPQLNKELKDLSDGALASGAAIDYIANKVSGQAEAAMRSGAGSVKALENAWNNLGKEIGKDYEQSMRGFIIALANYVNRVVEAKQATDKFKEALEILREEGNAVTLSSLDAQIVAMESKMKFAADKIERASAPLWKKLLFYNDELVRSNRSNIPIMQEYNEIAGNYLNILRQQADMLGNIENTVERTRQIAESTGSLTAINAYNEALQIQADYLMELETINNSIDHTKKNRTYAEEIELIRNVLTLNDELTASIENRARAAMQAAEKEDQAVQKANENRASIIDFRNKYEQSLRNSVDWALREANLTGEITNEEYKRLSSITDINKLLTENVSSTALQNQLLGIQLSAYKGLIDSSEGLLNGTLEHERAIESAIRTAQTAYQERIADEKKLEEEKKLADEEQKKRLAEFLKQQKELADQLKKWNNEAQEDAKKLAEIRDRALFDAGQKAESDDFWQIRVTNATQGYLESQALKLATARERVLRAQINDEHDYEVGKIRDIYAERERLAKETYDKAIQNTELTNEERIQLDTDYNNLSLALTDQRIAAELAANEEMNKKIAEFDKNLLQSKLDNLQSFVNASQQIAGNITTIWQNSIDYELNENLRKNDALEQSDEERARNKERLEKEAMMQQYEAQMAGHIANVILANAQAALAVLNQLTQGDPYTAVPRAIAAGVMGAVQVAAVISAEPKRPKFHEGGVVRGNAGQEVPAVLMAGEKVTTQTQFGNVMDAFANVAHAKFDRSAAVPEITINNTVSDIAKTNVRYDPSGVVIDIIDNAVSSGRLDGAFGRKNLRNKGSVYL